MSREEEEEKGKEQKAEDEEKGKEYEEEEMEEKEEEEHASRQSDTNPWLFIYFPNIARIFRFFSRLKFPEGMMKKKEREKGTDSVFSTAS